MREYAAPKLLAVNADEGEPGTFKDRHYLESDPHRFIEGMLIAAWAVGVSESYVYVRDEYPAVLKILNAEIKKVRDAGLATTEIIIRRGAGAYICGEESAMIESIEGKRGLPRNRPPFVAEVGLFGRPTLEHNVETLFWVRDIFEKGAAWFADAGRNGRKGWRSFSVSGRVKNPGVKLAPAGITVNELIAEFCGGMADGHTLKAYLPGGASGGILPAKLADVPLDFDTLHEHGCFIGSAAVVIFSEQDNMKEVALNLMRFFEDESCGQCTPCRVGTEKAVKLMEKPKWDTALLNELSVVMADASICGLGQAAGNPINSVLKYFEGICEMVKRRKAKTKRTDENKLPTQIIGNIGLFHVCYELSRRGFNVVPTSRNTRAVDVIVGSTDFARYKTVQVKTTTINMGIHIGAKSRLKTREDALAHTRLADFWVYVRLDREKNHSVDHVFVWKGGDETLLSEDTKHWWFETYSRKMNEKWEQQKNELGWRVIEDELRERK